MHARDLARFLAKVQVAGDGECWLWLASKTQAGYGQFGWDGISRGAHVFSWLHFNGGGLTRVPAGFEVAHSCGTRACVNPFHLSLATHAQNCYEDARRRFWRFREIRG